MASKQPEIPIDQNLEPGSDPPTIAEMESAVAQSDESSDLTPEDALLEARLEIATLNDRILRQAAEFQNFRKRALEERLKSVEIGRRQTALPMVDVLDDLRRSIEAADSSDAEGASAEAVHAGIMLVYEKFSGEIAKLGIQPMEVVGQPFDEDRHEAMMQQPAPDGVEAGSVIAEIQKGYLMGDKVLRHARVVVAN